jgi:hypothetical protein
MDDDDFKNLVRQIIREELAGLLGSSQYQFQKDAKFYDGRNIQTGNVTGTMIGTTTTQKLGFFGTTPITKPATPAATAAGIISLLQALGLSQ